MDPQKGNEYIYICNLIEHKHVELYGTSGCINSAIFIYWHQRIVGLDYSPTERIEVIKSIKY